MVEYETSLSRFIKGTLSTGVGKVSILMLGLFGVMIVTRQITPEDYGTFVVFVLVAAFLREISSFGLHLAGPKYITAATDEAKRRKIINTIIYFRLVTLILACLAALLLNDAIFSLFDSSTHSDLKIYVPILLVFESASRLLNVIFQGTFKFKFIGLSSTLSSIVNFIAIIALVIVADLGVWGLIYARLISRIITFAYAYVVAGIEHRIEFDSSILVEIVRFGLPLYANYILTFIFLRLDTILVGALLGPAELGLYAIAKRLPESLDEVYEAFQQVYYPFIARLHALGDHARIAEMLNTALRWLAFLCLLLALIALAFGNEIITLLFTNAYLESTPAFAILMIAVAFNFLDYTLGYTLVAVGQPNKPPIINSVRTVITFVSYLILIPALGIAGAASAGLAGTLLANPVNAYFLKRAQVKVRVWDYTKPILVFSILAGILVIVASGHFVVKILLLTSYLAVSIIFSVITVHDLATIVHQLRMLFSQYVLRKRSQPAS